MKELVSRLLEEVECTVSGGYAKTPLFQKFARNKPYLYPNYVQQLLSSFSTQQILTFEPGSILASPAPSLTTGPISSNLLHPSLSRREAEILQLLSKGQPFKEISRTLTIAPGTLKKHLYNIYTKLEVHNRNQALKRAIFLGLLD